MQAANLELSIDEENTLLENDNQSNVFYMHSVIESDSALTVFELDSSFASDSNFLFNMAKSGNTIQMTSTFEQEKFGKNQIQNIINGTKNSEWFYIHFVDDPGPLSVEKSTVSLLRLFGHDDTENPEALKLHLRYFEVTGSGF